MGLLDNDLPGLLSNVKNALLEAYDSATKPNGGMSNALAEYLMNTPNRFRDNVNNNFPDPRLLKQQNPEGQSARESIANALLNFGGMMVGPKAKTWNAADHAKALEMEAAGLDPRKIWADTGNWKGPEGAWRQEIPDNNAQFRENFSSFKPNKNNNYLPVEGPLGGLFSHGELLSQNGGAYPELMANTRMTISKNPDWMPESANIGALEQQGNNYMLQVRNKTEGGAKNTTLHELQHRVQEEEGFAKGGTPDSLFNKYYQEAKQLSPYASNVTLSDLASKRAFDAYKRLAGEAEARATEKRALLDVLGRRKIFPEDSYDIPMNELLIRR